jgi:hypothetical protein
VQFPAFSQDLHINQERPALFTHHICFCVSLSTRNSEVGVVFVVRTSIDCCLQ